MEKLFSSGFILQGPVSSGVLLGYVNCGGGDCRRLLSVRRGRHLTKLGLMLSIYLDDSSMLESSAQSLGPARSLPGQPGCRQEHGEALPYLRKEKVIP